MSKSIQYNKLAIHGRKFAIGDAVHIESFVGKIVKIALYPQANNTFVPLVEV